MIFYLKLIKFLVFLLKLKIDVLMKLYFDEKVKNLYIRKNGFMKLNDFREFFFMVFMFKIYVGIFLEGGVV